MRLRDFPSWLKAEIDWRVFGKRFEIRFSPLMQEQFDEAPREVQDSIMKRLEKLRKNPYSGVRFDEDSEETSRDLDGGRTE